MFEAQKPNKVIGNTHSGLWRTLELSYLPADAVQKKVINICA